MLMMMFTLQDCHNHRKDLKDGHYYAHYAFMPLPMPILDRIT